MLRVRACLFCILVPKLRLGTLPLVPKLRAFILSGS
jgi:hypothetical protein